MPSIIHVSNYCSKYELSQNSTFIFIYLHKGDINCKSVLQKDLHKLKFTQVKKICICNIGSMSSVFLGIIVSERQ
jgi:hypothetical protein